MHLAADVVRCQPGNLPQGDLALQPFGSLSIPAYEKSVIDANGKAIRVQEGRP